MEIGKGYYFQGDFSHALHEFNKALLADPNDWVAQEYVAITKKKLGRVTGPAGNSREVDKMMAQLKSRYESIRKNKPEQREKTKPEPALGVAAGKQGLQYFSQENSAAGPQNIQEQPAAPSENNTAQAKVLGGQEPASSNNLQSGISITGDYQVSIGADFDNNDILWNKANFDQNEKNWRTLQDSANNNFENTYDPGIFSRMQVNVDKKSDQGFGFHGNIDISPWSWAGKSSKFTLTGAGGDTAEVELKSWFPSGYLVPQTVYTQKNGDSFNIPELKVYNGRVLPSSINSSWDTFSLPETELHNVFWPLRELWFDYNSDNLNFRFFPAGLEDQAYTSDDLLGLSNHKIYWEESPWLDSWAAGHFNTNAGDFFKGYWDDSLSFVTRDSNGIRLTNLRGFSLNLNYDYTDVDLTIASPKTLWQDYEDVDTIDSVFRIKHLLFDNLRIGGIYTAKLGYKDFRRDATNQVIGFDLAYEPLSGTQVLLEASTSKSVQDKTSSYQTDKRGNSFAISVISSSQEEILGKNYHNINPDPKAKEPFYKGRLSFTHMDRGFEAGLSNYRETRDDSYWARHLHFRRPFDYYWTGLHGRGLSWYDIKPYAIGDGIDYGRDVIDLRYEFNNFLEGNLDSIFDFRYVRSTTGKFIESVTHLESEYRITPKLTAKVLGIYQKMPKTKAGYDPFAINADTGDYLPNAAIEGGKDPSLKTASLGAEYQFFKWLSANLIWERTNDVTLAYDNFPRGILASTWWTNYIEEGVLYRKMITGLYYGQYFPLPPYPYFDIFRAGVRIKPRDDLDIYLDWTRNEYEWAQAIDDNVNHIGLEVSYMPMDKLGLYFRYTYSIMNDYSELNSSGVVEKNSHHNFFGELRYRIDKDSELVAQYGVGGVTPVGIATYSPFGGSLATLDTQHILRMYYRRRF